MLSVAPRQFAAVLSLSLMSGIGVAHAAGPLDPYLPKSNKIEGHLVTLEIDPKDQAISQRFRHAVQGNMDWFQKAVRSNKPGEPLPYDTRMGITEAEYQQLEHMKPLMKEGAAVSITVEHKADGSIAFKPTDAGAAALKDVQVSADQKTVDTPYGKLAIFNVIKQVNSPFGAWNGVEWAKVELASAETPSAKLGFGRRDENGQGIMYYQVAPYKDKSEQSLVVSYKLD